MNKIPSLSELEKVSNKIKDIPNKRGEYKRKIHYCCYLLCSQSGLRITEAIKFDLSVKTKKGLYRINKPKGKKERFVFVPKEVIKELKTNNWQPNQTNRFNFYHFLRKIKRGLNISKNTELTPHTLRRAFTTYHAENGMPLPLLQKLLGHASIRTTALYWQNTHGDGDNDDIADILAGKKWLENKGKPPKPPITENFPEIPKNPKPPIVEKPVITEPKPIIKDNSPPPIFIEPKPVINYQPKMPIREISLKKEGKFSLNDNSTVISKKMPLITNNPIEETEKEKFLLAKIKNLEEKLTEIQTENNNLKTENNSLKEQKEKAESIAATEKQRADNYQQQLKTIAKAFSQWQKINYYQQLEKERAKLEAKIIQTPPSK